MPHRFSDRVGLTRPPELAREEAPTDLRVGLWNTFEPMLFKGVDWQDWRSRIQAVYRFLHWLSHKVPYQASTAREAIEKYFFGCPWFDAYNLYEFVAGQISEEFFKGREANLFAYYNGVLEKEGSPYRFVQGLLTPVTDPTEMQAVRDALDTGDRFSGAREHLTKALQFLGLRPEPDFRNTIKEAISAVESTLKVLTGHDHADLAAALREFAKTRPIHGALVKGLDSLYGYTSNEHGLRHALLEADANVGFAEAKFMVVACSAFVGYLIAREAP